MPPQTQHLSRQPDIAADMLPQGPQATILASHGSALVSAGLLATLGRLPQCVLRVWDRKQGLWHDPRSLEGVDLVVADAKSFVPATRSANDEAPLLRRATPRVVLIGTIRSTTLMSTTTNRSPSSGPRPPKTSSAVLDQTNGLGSSLLRLM